MSRWVGHEEWVNKGAIRINPKRNKPYLPEYAGIAENATASGMNWRDLAFTFGISVDNLKHWKVTEPDFKNALLKGKERVRAKLLRRGMEAAMGYTYEESEVISKGVMGENGEPKFVEGMPVRVRRVTKHVAPDNRLLMFLVSAIDRQLGKDDWLARQFVESKITKTETRKIDVSEISKQIDRLSSGRKAPEFPLPVEASFEPGVKSAEYTPVQSNSPDAGNTV